MDVSEGEGEEEAVEEVKREIVVCWCMRETVCVDGGGV